MKIKFTLKIAFFTLFLVALQSCMISSKPNIAFFDKSDYRGTKAEFTSINLPLFLAKPMIRKALRKDNDVDSKEIMNLISKIKKVKILTIENGEAPMLKDFAKYLTDNNYEDWVSIKHEGETVNIKAQQSGDFIKKLMLTVNSGSELVFIDIRGKFTPDDISKFINATNK